MALHINIDSLFASREEYGLYAAKKPLDSQRHAFIRSSLVEHLIVFGQPDVVVQKQITRRFQKSADYLNRSRHPEGLTLMHLCVITRRTHMVKWLLGKGASTKPADSRGWTALLHAAALEGDEILTLLHRAGASEKSRTDLGASVADIRAMVGEGEGIGCTTEVWIERDRQLELLDRTNEAHLATVDVELYTDYPLFLGPQRAALWHQPYRERSVRAPLFARIFARSLKETPRVVVKTSPLLLGRLRFTLGLFAGQNLATETPLVPCGGCYSGEQSNFLLIDMLTKPDLIPPHVYEDRDAASVGNVGRLVNEGFPNCRVEERPAFKGSPGWPLFVVYNEGGVPKGEELLINYGPGQIAMKWGHYGLIGKERMLDFFRETSPIKLKAEIEANSELFGKLFSKGKKIKDIRRSAYLRLLGRRDKLFYCLQTPAPILWLYCQGVGEPAEWHELVAGWEGYRKTLSDGHQVQLRYMEGFTELLVRFDSSLKGLTDENQRLTKEYLIAMMERFTMHQVVFGMEWIEKMMPLGGNWPLALEKIDPLIAMHDIAEHWQINPVMVSYIAKYGQMV